MLTLVIALIASMAGVQSQPPRDALAQARQAYNAQKYDDAIQLATEARQQPGLADAAAVVLARAHLERYRRLLEAADPRMLESTDLEDSRAALLGTDVSKLVPRDYVEFLIALGEVNYRDERYGVSAEMFELALGRGEALEPEARERLLEWWAGALDRQAQDGPVTERKVIYLRILRRAEQELERTDRSAMATYWLAAAARGADEIERAVSAAEAGWIRAPFLVPPGAKLRSDLDRLLREVILPERAIRLSPDSDPRLTLDALLEEWEAVKKKWIDK